VYVASPLLYEMLNRLNVGIVTIAVIDKHDMLIYREAEPQQRLAREVFRKGAGRVAWISTFDPQDWERPGFADRVIGHLDQTFKDGASGVKIYKTIGMELKSKNGKYLMPDDPVFDPILNYIASKGKTLYAHIAEPKGAWEAPSPSNPYGDYFYNMYRRTDHPPSKQEILAARDHMLEKHPNLKVVGCHLGSMEDDVDEVAKRFDRYPNFAVDTAARVDELMRQRREKVRAFLIKYQDRVLYGTDAGLSPLWTFKKKRTLEGALRNWEQILARDWKYFATADVFAVDDLTGQKFEVQGLALPEPVLQKIYHDNAVKWVPGLMATP
jgi:predicted TIM-barrel fold metal-dependent hydrolase